MTPKEKMLAAARGEMADTLAFAPRIDLWFQANKERGTLPEKYRHVKNADEIALSEGWALHKVILEFMSFGEDAIIDRCLGIYRIPTQGFISKLSKDVERLVEKKGDEYHIEYKTPVGSVSGTFIYTDAMRRSGISEPWAKEHVLKTPEDYKTLGFIFENLIVEPAYEAFTRWSDGIGENGLPVAYALTAGSPMHHIMKLLVDSTDFYYRYKDQKKEMLYLAEKIGVYFNKVIDVMAKSPADVILVGANFDAMLTYPPFFKEQILPWVKKAADKFHHNNKLLICHPDGENKGLMDLLYESGMDIADSVCPYPMTKISIAEYYQRWSDKITIFGGIPSNMMLLDSASDAEFEAYMEMLFKAISPGKRFIFGIADTVAPDASFERLQRIQELVLAHGKLPLKANSTLPEASTPLEKTPTKAPAQKEVQPEATNQSTRLPHCAEIREAVLAGDNEKTVALVKASLAENVDPQKLLNECLLQPMDIIGEKFTNGTVFIPEVLLSARTLNEAMMLLEPVLASQRGGREKSPLVLLGTIKGDMHDIGKNIVGIMFRSVGFRVKDLGINVSAKTFVEQVAAEKPQILALSALLTTTMPEFKNVIEEIKRAGLRDQVKIMVGGAPVSEQYAKSVGADAYGADAGQAAAIAKKLCKM
jgi:corrinoid protein of di/trimethylamine methyltransferase